MDSTTPRLTKFFLKKKIRKFSGRKKPTGVGCFKKQNHHTSTQQDTDKISAMYQDMGDI